MTDTRDCNTCVNRNCSDRPRLGKPVIFNCPKFKPKKSTDDLDKEELYTIWKYLFGLMKL